MTNHKICTRCDAPHSEETKFCKKCKDYCRGNYLKIKSDPVAWAKTQQLQSHYREINKEKYQKWKREEHKRVRAARIAMGLTWTEDRQYSRLVRLLFNGVNWSD